MGTVGREMLYWQDTPGCLQIGIDPGVEHTGLAFVNWPFGMIGTVERADLIPVLYRVLSAWAADTRARDKVDMLKLKVAYEEPSQTNAHTWAELGRIRGVIDCWGFGRPEVSVIGDRPCTAQQVRCRVERALLLLDALAPLGLETAGLSQRLPVHAREALATLVR